MFACVIVEGYNTITEVEVIGKAESECDGFDVYPESAPVRVIRHVAGKHPWPWKEEGCKVETKGLYTTEEEAIQAVLGGLQKVENNFLYRLELATQELVKVRATIATFTDTLKVNLVESSTRFEREDVV